VRGAQRVPRVRLVIFMIHERAKGRMYARVRSDLSGVIRIHSKPSSEVLVNHVAFAGYDGKIKILESGARSFLGAEEGGVRNRV